MSVDTLDHTAPRSPDRRERGLTHLGSPPRVSYVTDRLSVWTGPAGAVSAWMCVVPPARSRRRDGPTLTKASPGSVMQTGRSLGGL